MQVMTYKTKGVIEYVNIEESDGRYLAEPLAADHDIPLFDRSPYDGFAIKASENDVSGVNLLIVDEIGAGEVSPHILQEGEAIRIMTGAQIPNGADCVIMLEDVEEITSGGYRFIKPKINVKKGENISFRGEELKSGHHLVDNGTVVTPGVKALLATFGYAKVPVVRKPVVSIIATGTELLDIHEPIQPGKIRNSNGYMIESQVIKAGAIPYRISVSEDRLETILEKVEESLVSSDILITTGGVSVGDYDLLPEIYEKLGANVLFNKIAMRPGSVTTVAELNGKLLFGLSGNPSACFVGFELFARPILRHWLHSDKPFLQQRQAYLCSSFEKPNTFTRFIRGRYIYDDGKIKVSTVGLDKSSTVSSLAWADCLICLPGGDSSFKVDELIDTIDLNDQIGSVHPWTEVK
ncbi:molybdopterin molybdotransferase MoeA [Falsibacillus albus]|uniref:Molybdopterin molybdenumtransferase n=1 Tax=Falsibacillus albus TaxID=2478915 RepID=A0A3L7JXR8_9BACI|nr:gephyrin-like molybdotransferase Glp [Falsibacillus albus]RLQ95566.1 molybdopterin molybdenumtransferase MoeA [Falsibacillus albus]